MIRLFTTAYPEQSAGRRAEYQESLRRNLACAAIDEVRVLVEGDVGWLPESPKLHVRHMDRRPRFDDFFAWTAELAGPEHVSMIANTDVWFGPEIGVVERTLDRGECYALARWDGDRLFDRNDSQDCWIFRGPVVGVRGHFSLGEVRCDNRLLHELRSAGYHVLNPSFSIRARHLHSGQRDEYGETLPEYVQPPYAYRWPHNLLGPVATLLHNVRHPGEKLGWRFDRRRAARTLPARLVAKLFRRVAGPGDRKGNEASP